MHRSLTAGCTRARAAAAFALASLVLAAGADGGAGNGSSLDVGSFADAAAHYAYWFGRNAVHWVDKTPPADRITWGGLAACAGLGLGGTAGAPRPAPRRPHHAPRVRAALPSSGSRKGSSIPSKPSTCVN